MPKLLFAFAGKAEIVMERFMEYFAKNLCLCDECEKEIDKISGIETEENTYVCSESCHEEWETPMCSSCNGTGEGMSDGSICRSCRGHGHTKRDVY